MSNDRICEEVFEVLLLNNMGIDSIVKLFWLAFWIKVDLGTHFKQNLVGLCIVA